MARAKRDPRTKEELLNRMLSYDFDGDIRNVGAQPASIVRTGPHTLRLRFPDTDTVFDLSVHRPREFAKPAAQRAGEDRSFANQDEGGPEIVADDAAAQGRTRQRRRTTRQPAADERRAASN